MPLLTGYADTTSLFDELGLDSMNAFELIIITEQLAGLSVPLPDLPPIFTLGDAYAYYLAALESARLEWS
jgi:acyl carrier protein